MHALEGFSRACNHRKSGNLCPNSEIEPKRAFALAAARGARRAADGARLVAGRCGRRAVRAAQLALGLGLEEGLHLQ